MILLFWTLAGVVAVVLIVDTLKSRAPGDGSVAGVLSELDGEAAYRNIYAMEGGNDARILEEEEIAAAAELAEAERIRAEREARRRALEVPGDGDAVGREDEHSAHAVDEPEGDAEGEPEPEPDFEAQRARGQDMIQAMIRAAERAAHAGVPPEAPLPPPLDASEEAEEQPASLAEDEDEAGVEDLEDLFARLTSAGPVDLVGVADESDDSEQGVQEEDPFSFMDAADAEVTQASTPEPDEVAGALAFLDELEEADAAEVTDEMPEIELVEPEPTVEVEPLEPTLHLEVDALFPVPIGPVEDAFLSRLTEEEEEREDPTEETGEVAVQHVEAATTEAQHAIDEALATLFADLVESSQSEAARERGHSDTTEIPAELIEQRVARDQELRQAAAAEVEATPAEASETEAVPVEAAAIASAEVESVPVEASAESPTPVEPTPVPAAVAPAPAAPRPRDLGLDRDRQRVLIQEMFRRRLDERRAKVAG